MPRTTVLAYAPMVWARKETRYEKSLLPVGTQTCLPRGHDEHFARCNHQHLPKWHPPINAEPFEQQRVLAEHTRALVFFVLPRPSFLRRQGWAARVVRAVGGRVVEVVFLTPEEEGESHLCISMHYHNTQHTAHSKQYHSITISHHTQDTTHRTPHTAYRIQHTTHHIT